jgi:hypothetical protein
MIYLGNFCIYASFFSRRQRFAMGIYTKYCLKAHIYIEQKLGEVGFFAKLGGSKGAV